MKKISTILVVICLLLSMTGCLSAKLLRQAEALWKKNQTVDALLSVSASLQEDPNFEKSKLFMVQKYELGIKLIDKQLEGYQTLNEPIRSEKIVDTYEKLVKLNTQMNSFTYPFTDKKETYSWTPSEIRDYTEQYSFAKKEAVNAFLAAAETGTSWEEIDTYGKKALKNASTSIEQNRVNEAIPAIFYNKALSHFNLKNEKNYLIALKGFEFCTSWNPGYRDAEAQIGAVKASLADLYYSKALSLSTAKASRAQLKESLVEFEKAHKWVANYKDTKALMADVEERLKIYIYPVFPASNYSYLSNVNLHDSELPNDIRGLFLARLKKSLGKNSYYRFSKKTANGTLDSILHHTIVDMGSGIYKEPPFISEASKAGVKMIVKMEIKAGEKAGKIDTIIKDEQKSRPIKKPVVQVSYLNAEGKMAQSISRPPVEKIDQLENFRPELIKETLIQYGAVIPDDVEYKWEKTTETQYVRWVQRTETLDYPISFHWELIDIPTKKVVSKGSDSTKRKELSCVYTLNVTENGQYYSETSDGTKIRRPITPKETDMVTKDIIENFFKKTVSTITPYLKKQE